MPTFLAKKGAMKLSGLGSLSKDVFERRTPTGSVFFALFGSGFARDFEKIVCIKVKEPSETNLVTSRHNKQKRPHLRLTWVAQKRHCLSSLFFGEYTVFTNGGHAGENWCLVIKARRWRINKNCKRRLSENLQSV